MKVVHIIPSLNPKDGGPPAAVIGIATAEALAGQDVEVVCVDEPGLQEMIQQRYGTFRGLKEIEITVISRGSRLQHIIGTESRDALRDRLQTSDIVHLHGVWDPLLLSCSRVARSMQIPYGITPHGMLTVWALNQRRAKKRIALALGYRSMLAHARFVHVVGEAERAATAKLDLEAPLYSIPLGVQREEFEPLPEAGSFRRKHPVLRDDPYIIFLSRLHPGKGLDLLAEAFITVSSKVPQARLVVVGPDAGALHDFERRIDSADLSNRVLVTGPLYGPEKTAALRDATCFCLPSEHEACSVAILEALACGVPTVLSHECDRPEVAEVGAGRLVARDPAAIAEALEEMLTQPESRDRMSDAALELARSRFTWDRIAIEMADMYEAAVTPGSTRGSSVVRAGA